MEWWLLENVPEEDVRRLLHVARRRTFRRGEVVFHQHDPGDSLHLIVKGRFAIRAVTPLGEHATVAIRGPGDVFGEMALFSDEDRRSATVEALEDAETFAVYEGDFTKLCREHPEVSELLIRLLVNSLRAMNTRLLEALYVPAERRILARINELCDVYQPGSDGYVDIPLSQDELAELAGTSRATVNVVLGEAQRRGLVELHRGRIRCLNRDELRRRARLIG